MLFARSIRENLLVGKPDATDAEMRGARSGAPRPSEFMARQPDGLDTIVGERGRSLSGGERQRLSIARALLKNPPILILDEATSALDAATERKLQKALEEVMKGRTTFVIAHRSPRSATPTASSSSSRGGSSRWAPSTSSSRRAGCLPISPRRSSPRELGG